MSASIKMVVADNDQLPIVSRALIDAKEVSGEKVPGIDPFVAYKHASRRKKQGEELEYELTDNGGIQIFYGTEYLEDETQMKWGFSIRIEVLDGSSNEPESNDTYVEVRYNPKIENHNDGERIWKRIVDRLEEKTEDYHENIKEELYG